MRPLGLDEVVERAAYGALREGYRQAVIAHKKSRRLAVGESVTLVFEDRETLRFQVQEMLWVERIDDPVGIQHELDVYNELMPGARELSATLFIEITDPARVRPELDRLIGIDEHVALVLGEGAQRQAIRARFDSRQMEADRVSAVQYIRFALDGEQQRRLADLALGAAVEIDHPNYRRRGELAGELRRSLVADLSREPEPLLRRPTEPE